MRVSYEPPLFDDQLAASLLRDDEKAFSEIYNRYWQRLYVFALSKLNDETGAEETIQTVFVDLWQKRRRNQIDNLSSYLYKAVKNKCIDHIRQRLVKDRHEEFLLNTFVDEDMGTEELLALQELKAVIDLSMKQLPEKTREIFKLSRLDGLSVREVSLALSVPQRTVEYHLAHALKVMRGCLRDFIVFGGN
ncbi:RNA polymerase sigma-70 factor [Dyadobacter pollutisoli]|jgi:RNA polymerase sigma-70 factor (ECF subfamily)|uniref:RNA polymerase sigma-70 factor n=1 Tax=Dyadobacter pollutisoli TaxID=2910158 RepID=A0A9E8NHF0_9BACT|nr:RNA polymerase sigma-70 factor [Dyadobacter pollutisoli]WAC15036.1 RNA polymerase sigma-70 factor [Dyadobacter pollutisoli]